MRQRLLILILMILSPALAYSQNISYILPDIGAPGMNIYVEVIGHYNTSGNFGFDGFYSNNRGDNIRIEPLNLSDTTKIVFGPFVVSWNGRMISTQVFVNPNISPNSYYWSNLTNQFRIPFRIYKNGTYSNIDTFYIVQPFAFGDKTSSAERTIGQGGLGIRSRRGAMIVDSMVLANETYLVSMNDCDPNTDGNQAYLPFVLISKGNIRGLGGNTKITVDGNDVNGGAGGGGGGGNFCDGSFLNPMSGRYHNGGNGFTGGGPGGRNGSLISNEFLSPGIGTSNSGYSLNGVPPPQPGAWESSGGGTGHPFGTGGSACGDGVGCNPTGGNGGGSGYRNNEEGGSGGYATNGYGTSGQNGGIAHGNIMVVPLAGGSGAASGNPNRSHECSGSGGGGGGALSVYGKKISYFGILARGANAPASSYGLAPGGAGAGGYAGMQSKISIDNASFQTPGGSSGRGGAGRVRFDSPFISGYDRTTEATLYFGMTTDTSTWVDRNFTLRGSRLMGRHVTLYLKPESGSWIKIDVPDNPDSLWSINLTLPGTDSLYYLTGLQDVNTPNKNEYLYEPAFVFSQAGANILHIQKLPKIAGDTLKKLRTTNCPGNSLADSSLIWNEGDGILTTEFNRASFVYGNRGFQLLTPIDQINILPNDSQKVIVKYSYQAGQTGIIRDTLLIPHNDFKSLKKPWKIAYEVTIDSLALASYKTDMSARVKMIDLGDVCLNSVIKDTFAIKNLSQVPVTLKDISHNDATVMYETKDLDTEDTAWAITSISVVNEGMNLLTFYIKIEECEEAYDTVVYRYRGVVSRLQFSVNRQFKDTRTGSRDTIVTTLKAAGSGSSYILSLPVLNAPFKIIDAQPAPPVELKPNEEMTIKIEFYPQAEGDFTDILKAFSVKFNRLCPSDTASITLTGKGIEPDYYMISELDFGTLPFCRTKDSAIVLKNNGGISFNLSGRAVIAGSDYQSFSIITEPAANQEIKPGDSTLWVIRFDAGTGPNGNKTATLKIFTDLENAKEILVTLKGKRDSTSITIDPNPVSFGVMPVGQAINRTVRLTNNSEFDVVIGRVISDNVPIVTINPNSTLIKAGGFFDFTAVANPTQKGDFNAIITYYIDQPCPDSIKVEAMGTAIDGKLAFEDPLDFGSLAPCKDSTDTLTLSNLGSGLPVEITDISLDGNTESLFSIINPLTGKVTLNQNESLKIAIKFDPKNSPDGTKEAYLIINATIAGKDTTYRITLKGERKSGLLATPSELDFGIIQVNKSSDKTIIIRNTGSVPIKIDNILPPANPFVMSAYSAGRMLQPGDTIQLTVTFTPDTEKDFIDTIKVMYLFDSCPGEVTIALMGRGTLLQPMPVRIWLPVDTLISPKLDDFHLPLYARLEQDTGRVTGLAFETEISFNYTLFAPRYITNGQITSDTIKANGIRKIGIKVDSIDVTPSQSVAAYIIGYSLIGNDDSTEIKFSQPNLLSSGSTAILEAADGLLRITICREGGDQLIKSSSPMILLLSPNPADGEFEADITMLESGEHRLEIIDVLGKSVYRNHWVADPRKQSHISFNISTNGMASGVYYVVLSSANRKITEALYIQK